MCILLWWALSFPDIQWAYPVRHTACHKTRLTPRQTHPLKFSGLTRKTLSLFCQIQQHFSHFTYSLSHFCLVFWSFSTLEDNNFDLASVPHYFEWFNCPKLSIWFFFFVRSWLLHTSPYVTFSLTWLNPSPLYKENKHKVTDTYTC